MKSENFIYEIKTNKDFNEAVVSVIKAVEQKGWSLFQIYDLSERLAVKGFKQEPLKIIEICSAKYASLFLNKNKLVSICLPCRINVLQEKGKVRIFFMKPTIISEFFPEIEKMQALEAEKEVKEIVDNSK